MIQQIENENDEVKSGETQLEGISSSALVASEKPEADPKAEALKEAIAALENKDVSQYSEEDYLLLVEAAKSGLAAEVFALAVSKDAINSKEYWRWSSVFIQCIKVERSLTVSFCGLFKDEQFKKIDSFKTVFQQCLFQGASKEVFNLIKNVPLDDLSEWNFELTILITGGSSGHKVGKELFSLFFRGKKASELRNWKDVLVWFDLYLEEGNELLEMLKNEPLEEIKQWEDFLKRFIKDPDFSEKALSVFLENSEFGAKDLRFWHDTIKTALSYSNVKNNSLKFISLFSTFSLDEIGLYESVDILERCVFNGLSSEVLGLLNKFSLEDLHERNFVNLLELCAERGAAREVLSLLKSKIKSFDDAKDWKDTLKTCLLNIGLSFVTKKQES